MSSPQNNIFEKHPRITLVSIILVLIVICVTGIEIVLKRFTGLGSPILYYTNPLFGYRLIPNQHVKRFYGSIIKINNLGLRANSDWDDNINNKILFLGDSVTYGGSYISNNELFSQISLLQNKKRFQSGNAGVNAWGVENIYGLIVDAQFLPAKTYVTVLPELDFYRGFVTLKGLPYWSSSPKYALKELCYFLMQKILFYRRYHQANIREIYITEKEIKNKVLLKAVRKLKKMDSFFKKKGYTHCIFITPTKDQIVNNADKDKAVENMIKEFNIKVTYLSNEIKKYNLSNQDKEALFHDNVHLSKKGHKLWGQIIGKCLNK